MLLSVEDSDAFAQAIQIAIEEAGLDVDLNRVEDGEQAMRFLRHENPYEETAKPTLVLLDLNLPKKSGFDVLGEMRSDSELSDIPVVVLSSSNHANDRKKSMELGAKAYILKPGNFDELMAELVVACETYLR